jgi:RNA polymerase sigma-70 factor (ECF subfamily)
MSDRPQAETLDGASVVAGGVAGMAHPALERPSVADVIVDLVLRAQRGDAEAFDRLARRRLDPAFRLAVAILRSESDAADAVQEAFISAWRQLPSLRDPARFDAWLDRIVVNACRMALRHQRGGKVREITVSDPARQRPAGGEPLEPGPEDRVADVELVRRALSRLDADKRTILVLHHVEGRGVDEIAAVLGIPSGTAKWRLHAARGELQRALEEVSR